eukprot:SAG11_NODE_10561_length_821_cov_1.422438_1_plen_68_part_00
MFFDRKFYFIFRKNLILVYQGKASYIRKSLIFMDTMDLQPCCFIEQFSEPTVWAVLALNKLQVLTEL